LHPGLGLVHLKPANILSRRLIGRPPEEGREAAPLRFFFTVTLDRPDLSRRLVLARFPLKLPAVLNVEEVGQLHRNIAGSCMGGFRAPDGIRKPSPSSPSPPRC